MYAQPAYRPAHSAGQTLKGLRTAIDPSQIPSPADAIEADRERWLDNVYTAIPGERPPLATTEYVAQDSGTSTPKFIRFTTWSLPSTSRLARECEIPLAAIVQPFADTHPQEEPVPLVESGPSGPARCTQCRGYINAWCTWEAGGSRWKCNLCTFENPVSNEYFCNLDASGRRLDYLQRPELYKGTVDYTVPSEYWAPHPTSQLTPSYYSPIPPSTSSTTREPKPMDFLFAFDLSADAVHSGFVETAADMLRLALFGRVAEDGQWEVAPCIPQNSRVAIVTYSRDLQFYDLSAARDRAHMLVVPDIDEVFVPLHDGLFVEPQASQHVIEDLLNTLPALVSDTQNYSCLGSAVRASLAAFADRGGHVILFHSSLPTHGPGSLTPRTDESNLYDTDAERSLFTPRSPAWTEIAEECAEAGVGISLFLAPSRFVDVGSLGVLANTTGGSMFFHPRFDALRDSLCLSSQFRRVLSRTTAYNCLFRVRCSSALRVTAHHGSFNESGAADLAAGVTHADSAFSVSFAHAGRLSAREYAHVQVAVLYTSPEGSRRVRVVNLALQVADLAGNVFRMADADAVVCHLTKEAMTKLPRAKMSVIREELSEACASILLGYRKNCAAATAPSQLILPEAFRSLPAYILGLLKSKPLKGGTVASDVRNYHLHRLLSSGAREIMYSVYPRVVALHDLDDNIALSNESRGGRVDEPAGMRPTYLGAEGHGVYLADNEEMAVFWLGSGASPALIRDLFGAEDIANLRPNLIQLPHLPTRLSAQVQNILASRRAQRGGREPKLLLARQQMDGSEIEFGDMLVEDANNANLSYVDYLCQVHRQIHAVLTQGGSIRGAQAMRTPW